jgi:hypothetical protein
MAASIRHIPEAADQMTVIQLMEDRKKVEIAVLGPLSHTRNENRRDMKIVGTVRMR